MAVFYIIGCFDIVNGSDTIDGYKTINGFFTVWSTVSKVLSGLARIGYDKAVHRSCLSCI